jgi:putative peptidoglycan lipid II flippase
MAFATLISRITGFAKIVLLATILGAAIASAYSVANQLPTLIAALVLEATFTAIFVPVLARAEREDADGGADFVRRLVTLATTLLLLTAALSVACAPLLVGMMLGSHSQVSKPLTIAFAYLLLPQVLFYGLSSVFMAILNSHNMFRVPAWAPVVNNIVAITTLGVYVIVPGELSVEIGNTKLLVLGIGTTLGVFMQALVLRIAIARERISLRPLWGIDDRLKQFGAMAAAMVLYVLISQFGLVVGNRIASWAAASGPAIYNYTWLVLMLPFGMIGVTVLTVVMPRLSRNAAADDIPSVLADLALATRLTMLTLIPTVAFMTVGGSAIGSALFAYGKFGSVDAGYLGSAIALSAFTLLPYAMVLLQLRVFYARQQPWTPILIILVITTVKIAASLAVRELAAHHVIGNPEMVAGYLGLANGLGFLAGATVGYLLLRPLLLRPALNPPGGLGALPSQAEGPPARGGMFSADVLRTVLVTIAASMLAGLVAYLADRLLGLYTLTADHGGGGSLLRLLLLALIMLPIIASVMLTARVPEAQAALAAVRHRLGGATPAGPAPSMTFSDKPRPDPSVPYPEHRFPSPLQPRTGSEPGRHGPGDVRAEGREGMAVTDEAAGSAPPDATTGLTRPLADDFQPDVAAPDVAAPDEAAEAHEEPPAIPQRSPPPGDFAGDPTRESMGIAAPPDTADSSRSESESGLVPGASIGNGRYRLLVFHGGPDNLQFWQALDTALNRQVALTFVDPDGRLSPDEVQSILSHTLRLSRINMPGIARVLDVVRTGTGGLIVSEWIRGGSLPEVAFTSPSPVGGARAMLSIAAAAETAHRSGVLLSVDHPSRVRVSIEGDVALAFPATMPGWTPEDDVRGIGAALYALLIDRWALPESGEPSGLVPADRDPAGNPIEPKSAAPEIPFQISAAAARAVRDGSGITTASTLLNLMQQVTAEADLTELISPVEHPAPRPPSRLRAAAGLRGRGDLDEEERTRRRKGLLIGLSVGGAILVVALLVLAWALKGLFADVGTSTTINAPAIGANSPTPGASPSTTDVKPLRATVFSPEGGADSPGSAGLAIDGNPSTAWATDTYTDGVPFPGFKNGVGLMLQLPEATKLSAVNVNLSSTGTKIQIRSAATDSPGSLDDTVKLTEPISVQPGSNRIPVTMSSPTSYVLVWIATLGTTDGANRSDIYEIGLERAS